MMMQSARMLRLTTAATSSSTVVLAAKRSVGVARTAAGPATRFTRQMATDTSPVVKSESPLAAAPAPAPVPTKTVVVTKKAKGTVIDRMWAFLAGIGIGGVVGYFKLTDDIWQSTSKVDSSISLLRSDVADANAELRRRVSTLEHEIAKLKK